MATPTIDPRLERLERRAESDDETIHSILRLLERMDHRLASLEADVKRLKADTTTLKADADAFKVNLATMKSRTIELDERERDHGLDEYRLLSLKTSVDRRRPFALSPTAGSAQTP